MKKCLVILLVAFIPVLLYAAIPTKVPVVNLPVITGNEEVNAPIIYPPYPDLRSLSSPDEIGDTIKVGTTWYENQHNGTIGRMIERLANGEIHVSWMNGLDFQASSRHIFYNYIAPNGQQNWPQVGVQVDGSLRGGFVTLDVDFGGIAFPAFHQIPGGSNPKTTLACDILPHTGAFLTYQVPNQPPPGMTNEVIWPRMQIDHQQRIHFVSTESSPNAGDPQRIMYSYGTYDPGSYSITYPTPNTWQFVDTTMTIAAEVATSEVSNKVAIAWTHSRYFDDPNPSGPNQYNNDIYYVVSNNGTNFDFAHPINLTNFIPPDLSYLPDTLRADMDTLRAYTDIGAFYDNDDYLHIAFTTSAYYELEGMINVVFSLIWHWSEQYPNEFHLVANGWSDFNSIPGAWSRNVQRPCLGQNSATGWLYCLYQQYDQDPNRVSAGGFPSGEIYVSVSTDGGLSWSVGTNVTHTLTPDSALAGQCLSELTPSLAKRVDNYCHILYVLDKDAGNILQVEGDWTLNNVYYHRVPINQIPVSPLIPDTIPFHVTQIPPNPVSIDLTPYGTIVLPPSGGNFYYNVALHNSQTTPATFDVWTMVRLPNGNWYPEPIVGPVTRTLPGSALVDRDLTQYVPANAPAGQYTYEGRVGDYPNTVWDTDSFTFTKAAGGQEMGDWSNALTWSGDLFNDLAASRPSIPEVYALEQNYPNPFNPTTAISYQLSALCFVNLSVYDIAGNKVVELVNGWREAGSHSVTFDASGLASGIYLYKLEAGGFTATKKLILLK